MSAIVTGSAGLIGSEAVSFSCDRGHSVFGIDNALRKVFFGRKYRIFGYKGKQDRDTVHSHDLVNAFYHAFKNPRVGEVHNMRGGGGH